MLGCRLFEPAPPGPAIYLFVEGATPDEVTRAIAGGPAPTRRLEAIEGGTLGWVPGGGLGHLAGRVSKALRKRAYAVTDDAPDALRVIAYECGEEVGMFQDPPSRWEDVPRLTSAFGETSGDAIRRKLGLPR
jgi:hypothetical protein